jgi:hypothetical protein
MHLSYRPADVTDIAACLSMIPENFHRRARIAHCLPALWTAWLRERSLQLAVVERDEIDGRSIVGFGAGVFLTDEFVSRMTEMEPPISASIHELALRGDSPILTLPQMQRSNSGDGLNNYVLMIGWAHSLENDPAALQRVKAALLDAFYYMHAGYKIKNVLQEMYEDDEVMRARQIGAHILADNRDRVLDGDNEGSGCCLMGATPYTVLEGSALWPMFLYDPPQLFFSLAEQDVLRLALLDHTDDQIAAALHISCSSVHKRWRGIIERASDTDVIWMPRAGMTKASGARGLEKRRHLLSYLRSHPEELRPVLRPRKRRERPQASDESADK